MSHVSAMVYQPTLVGTPANVWEFVIKRGLFLFIAPQVLMLRLTNYMIA